MQEATRIIFHKMQSLSEPIKWGDPTVNDLLDANDGLCRALGVSDTQNANKVRDAHLRLVALMALDAMEKVSDPCPAVSESAKLVIESHLKRILGVLSDEN